MNIFYVGLEELEQRYTKMFNNAFKPYCNYFVYPEIKDNGLIEKGQFLDINKTCIFKAKQLEIIANYFKNNIVKNGDCFVFADIFFPGIEMLRYMAELADIKIFIFAFNHAGRADKTDFVQKLGKWSDFSEAGYHYCCDAVFVGSKFHKMNIIKYFKIPEDKIFVTGPIWDIAFTNSVFPRETPHRKEDFIIYPHRLCKEKGFDDFIKYAENTDKKIIITTSGNPVENIQFPKNVEYKHNLTKAQYYEIMSRARWYLSTAYQETFGYTVQEAIWYGCEILAPDRACYPEMLPERNLYKNINEIDKKFREDDLKVPLRYTLKWNNNIKKMLEIIKERSIL